MKNFFINIAILALISQGIAINKPIIAEEVSLEYIEQKKTSTEFLFLLKEAKEIVPGNISIKYEVGNSDGGYISSGKGDAGGKSYGVSQFTQKGYASANTFIEWLSIKDSEFGVFFSDADKAGTESFDFNSTLALQESAYSLAVQFGKNGALTIARNSGINQYSSEEEIIKLLFSEKRNSVGTYKFLYCSEEVQNSVYDRFIREKQDVLNLYYNNPCNSIISIELETI